MTIVRRGEYKGSLPGKIGRAARRSGLVGPLKPPQFSSELVSVDPGLVANPEREMHLRRLVNKFSGDLNRKAMKVKFLSLLDPGSDRQLRLGPAWRATHPGSKATDKSCRESGSALYAEILADLGVHPDPTDVLLLCGISVGSIGEDLDRMRRAKTRREYYDFKTKEIIYGESVDDTMAILRQVELSMRAIGLGREKDVASAVVVNIVSYLPGPVAEQRPWSGGGRAIDGRLQDTVGPNSPAARAALPAHAVALPDGALGEPKNSP